jgi:hypothetical protein
MERSFAGLEVISFLKKNNLSVFQGLKDILADKAYISTGVGC